MKGKQVISANEIAAIRMKKLLTESDVAILYSIPVSTLRTERSRGRGPGFFKDGGKIRYTIEDLDTYYLARAKKTEF